MPGDPRHLLAQAPRELGGETVPGRIGTAEQRHAPYARSTPRQLTRQLERHRAAGAEAGENVRAVRLERPHLLREVRREILDAPERLAPAVEPGRLEPEEGLVVAQLLCQRAIAEHVTVVPGHREHRRARAASLERHDRARPLRQLVGRAQEFQDLALASLQLVTQLGGERPGRGRAPQVLALGPDLDIAAAQLREKRRHAHSSTTSRSRLSSVSGWL